MKLLLDTCTLIWLTSESSRLSKAASRAIDDAASILHFSDASTWEICLKWQNGKLGLPTPPRSWIPDQLARWQIEAVPLEAEDFFRTTELASHHPDPFDRLLVAQAIFRGLTIVTPDPAIAAYPAARLW
ncbi:MAG: type II toxin-antitoxin system VapC family toxin [Myxococcales bacterium]|nr:type II toxin-antitoxin system VapC family toxin [Myxococcales bacterium]